MDASRNRDARQIVDARKRLFSDKGDALRNIDTGHFIAFMERKIANGSNAIGNVHKSPGTVIRNEYPIFVNLEIRVCILDSGETILPTSFIICIICGKRAHRQHG